MKIVTLVILLLIPTFFWAAPPSDHPITVHVISSCNYPSQIERLFQKLNVLIDGKKYELVGKGRSGLLTPGDYKARLLRDEHPTAYESFQEYEFLFPDKKTRKFEVYGQTE